MSAAKERELSAWKKIKVTRPVKAGTLSESVAETRSAITWEIVEGGRAVKAHLVARGKLGSGPEERLSGDVGERQSPFLSSSGHIPGRS